MSALRCKLGWHVFNASAPESGVTCCGGCGLVPFESPMRSRRGKTLYRQIRAGLEKRGKIKIPKSAYIVGPFMVPPGAWGWVFVGVFVVATVMFIIEMTVPASALWKIIK